MSGFKRFVYIVSALAGLLGLAALFLSWYGPWTKAASAMLTLDWYYRGIEVLVGIAAIALLVVLVKGIVTSGRTDTVVVDSLSGGSVTVTRDAVASKTTSIVEADDDCIADEVDVAMSSRGKGSIRVHVRVQPVVTLDVIAKGNELHDELQRGLANLCGDRLDDVTLQFIEPQTEEYLPSSYEREYSEPASAYEVPSAEPAVDVADAEAAPVSGAEGE